MGEVKFTPGPWAVEDPMEGELTIVEAGKPTYEWRFIASCSLPDGDDDQAFTGKEVYANATLIAAAPAMYEALKVLADAVSRYIEVGPLKGVRSDLARGRDMAEAALSSAEGRASLKEQDHG